MLFRGKTFQEAVGKGLEYFGATYETAEVNLVKGLDPGMTDSEDEFIVEVVPNSDMQVDGTETETLYHEDGFI